MQVIQDECFGSLANTESGSLRGGVKTEALKAKKNSVRDKKFENKNELKGLIQFWKGLQLIFSYFVYECTRDNN